MFCKNIPHKKTITIWFYTSRDILAFFLGGLFGAVLIGLYKFYEAGLIF